MEKPLLQQVTENPSMFVKKEKSWKRIIMAGISIFLFGFIMVAAGLALFDRHDAYAEYQNAVQIEELAKQKYEQAVKYREDREAELGKQKAKEELSKENPDYAEVMRLSKKNQVLSGL